MKTKYLFLFILLAFVASCKNDKPTPKPQQDVFGQQPEMALSSNDTATVKKLTTDFLELVKQGQVEAAVNQIYMLENDDVRPLPDDEKQKCLQVYGQFEIKDYAINKLTFFKETDSEVEFSLYLDAPSPDRKQRGFRNMIRPVRRNGVWYITLANGYQHSEIEH